MSSAAAATSAGVSPMLSFATRYAPPPVGYAKIVWRYENATISSSSAMTALTGVERLNAAAPPIINTRRISSVA